MFNSIQNRLQKVVSVSREAVQHISEELFEETYSISTESLPNLSTESAVTLEMLQTMSPTEICDKLNALQKLEVKLPSKIALKFIEIEITQSYRSLQKKAQHLETLIKNHTPITAITKTDDVSAADEYLKKLKEMAEVIMKNVHWNRIVNQRFRD
jgi:hypothetical protein